MICKDPWMNELYKNVEFISGKKEQRIWRSQSRIALEKRIMISCYIVRKLHESKHVSVTEYNTSVELYEYVSLGEKATDLQSRKLNELYKLDSPNKIKKPFSFVVNQLIHSFSFVYVFKAKNQLEGFAFNSDRTKNGAVFLITLSEFLSVLCPIVGYDEHPTTLILNSEGKWVILDD